jgi:RimJ/RimL family protein N-acetyltransferase
MITGKITNLRAYEKADLSKLFTWANDSALTKFVGPRFPVSMCQEEIRFEQLLENESRVALIIETKNKEAIGYIYLDLDWVNRKAELSIAIGEKDYQNNGYGTDACLSVLSHCFNELNLNKVFLYVFKFNERAIKSYIKCGFKEEGVVREDYLMHGQYQDRLIMSILKSEYTV